MNFSQNFKTSYLLFQTIQVVLFEQYLKKKKHDFYTDY